jgi:hypothetical protein
VTSRDDIADAIPVSAFGRNLGRKDRRASGGFAYEPEIEPSPAKAMSQLDRARGKNELVKLKSRRTWLRDQGKE